MTKVEYYHYFGRPLKIEFGDNGEQIGLILDEDSGEFVEAGGRITAEAQINMMSADIWSMSFGDFVFETESARATYVSGDGPVFPLYQIVKGIFETAYEEGRILTDEERELVDGIYHRTYALWEAGEALS